MPDRIQFREDEDTIAYVQSKGINPNEMARDLFERQVRRMRADDWSRKIKSFNIRLQGSAAALIREGRDSH